ncbi:MAG TPA: NADH-quinone oxidoreductase subunit A [Acidobacteriota bacterium]|nr:NADH-quinone oxidoreductase subunit A [Acidobacteriota bacterium]
MTGYAWQYTFLGLFFLLVTVFAMLPVVASRIVRPKKPSPGKLDPYECGVEKVGDAWIQFKIQYYLYALVFIVFDVEVVLIIPWAVVFKQLGIVAFIEMAIFLLILFVGLIYVWRKRDLEWY